MRLNPGMRLRSQVCTTEVIVVRSGKDEFDVRCGGAPMVEHGTPVAESGSPVSGLDSGTELGKRYTTADGESLIELLATKAGAGALSIGTVPLTIKQAKPLPASD